MNLELTGGSVTEGFCGSGAAGQRDVEPLLSYLREIYVSSDLEGFASRVVSALPRLLPSESASYTEIDVRSRKIGAEVMDPPASDAASAASIFDRHAHEHPLIDYYRRTGEGRSAKISDFLTRSQWRNRALYNECFKEVRGMEHLMTNEIGAPALTDGVALGRSGRDFSEKDWQLLDLLPPPRAGPPQRRGVGANPTGGEPPEVGNGRVRAGHDRAHRRGPGGNGSPTTDAAKPLTTRSKRRNAYPVRGVRSRAADALVGSYVSCSGCTTLPALEASSVPPSSLRVATKGDRRGFGFPASPLLGGPSP